MFQCLCLQCYHECSCGKGWKSPQLWELMSSWWKSIGPTCDSSLHFSETLFSESVGCVERWSGVTGSPVPVGLQGLVLEHFVGVITVPAPPRRTPSLDLLRRLSKGQSLPRPSCALTLVETAELSFEASGQKPQQVSTAVLSFWGKLQQFNFYLVIKPERTLMQAPAPETTGKVSQVWVCLLFGFVCLLFFFCLFVSDSTVVQVNLFQDLVCPGLCAWVGRRAPGLSTLMCLRYPYNRIRVLTAVLLVYNIK